MEEMIDVYDRDGRPTGKRIRRGEPFGPGEFARIVQIVIFNKEGKMLIQQRQPHMAWGGLWDVTLCGGIMAGEGCREAAARELREELGLSHDFSEDMPNLTVFYGEGFSDVFLLEMELQPEDLTLQPEEVKDVRWASIDEILAMMGRGEFISYYPGWIRYLSEARHGYGNFLT